MRITSAIVFLFVLSVRLHADEQVYSGPQPGEKLSPFKATYALDAKAGEPFDIVTEAKTDSLLLVFVHELTRPSIGLIRLVVNYAAQRQKDGLHSAIVFLTDDVSAMEARIKRARHALPTNVPIGVSMDGIEGPGSYGLNRKVTLTILVAKDGRVTANFALVQPSIKADAPRIGKALAKALGDKKSPTLAEMGGGRYGRSMTRMISDAEYRRLMRPVIDKTATAEEVKAAAKRVEALAEQNPALKTRIGSVARRIIGSGRLASYGTETAQEFLRKWAQEFKAPTRNENNNADEEADDEDKAPAAKETASSPS